MRIKRSLQIKEYIKKTTDDIRKCRNNMKITKDVYEQSKFAGNLYTMKRQQRHFHIAYSELLGHIREQIEHPRKDNMPNEELVNTFKSKILSMTELYDETVEQHETILIKQ